MTTDPQACENDKMSNEAGSTKSTGRVSSVSSKDEQPVDRQCFSNASDDVIPMVTVTIGAQDSPSKAPSQYVSPLVTRGQEHEETLQPKHGCIVLGNQDTGTRYTTRFHIDHHLQRQELGHEILLESCAPSCVPQKQGRTCRLALYEFVSADAFLLTLHLAAVVLGVLGVVEEAMDMQTYAEHLQMAHNLAEIVVTVLLIVLRIVQAYRRFAELKNNAYELEYISPDVVQEEDVRGKGLKRWLKGVTLLGVLLILLAVACFVAFYFLVHLGWTVLSNQFCLVVFLVVANLYSQRVTVVLGRIKQDQHRVVLLESLLLLSEARLAYNKQEMAKYFELVEKFERAVKDTEMMKRPEHILLEEEEKARNKPKATELQSLI